jgi:putative serine/threonine protein kinase
LISSVLSPVKSSSEIEEFHIPISVLNPDEHGTVICYPGTDLSSFDHRITQLERLGIEKLILEGDSKIGRYGVLGKGCVSVVVRAVLKNEPGVVALKIRRVDANRPSMQREFELQKLANAFGVGPRAISVTSDLFAMEYIDAVKIGKWFAHLKTRESKKYTSKLVRNILRQCFLLDLNQLDQGELSNPSKHILIRRDSIEPKITIIDFESASTARKSANLTSVAQFLFLGGAQSAKLRKILGLASTKNLKHWRSKFIDILRDYKEGPSSEKLEGILDFLNLRSNCFDRQKDENLIG